MIRRRYDIIWIRRQYDIIWIRRRYDIIWIRRQYHMIRKRRKCDIIWIRRRYSIIWFISRTVLMSGAHNGFNSHYRQSILFSLFCFYLCFCYEEDCAGGKMVCGLICFNYFVRLILVTFLKKFLLVCM